MQQNEFIIHIGGLAGHGELFTEQTTIVHYFRVGWDGSSERVCPLAEGGRQGGEGRTRGGGAAHR